MDKVKCTLICHSMGQHLQQVYTGYFMLHQRGLIRLSQRIIRPRGGAGDRLQCLRVVLGDDVRVCYDTRDGRRVDPEYLDEADFYFKRSYDASYLATLGEAGRKVRPLGLNYLVYPDGRDMFALWRSIRLVPRGKLREIWRSLRLFDSIRFFPFLSRMEALPDYRAEPKVLFMVDAKDPENALDKSAQGVDQRMYLNDMRSACIKALREALGDKFYGGFMHTDFARRNYNALLMPDGRTASKKNYINLLRSYPICVATTGLHGSIGWKFGEYVAFGKAIVSERLEYEVPGNFRKDVNYLEFASPQECVEQALRLMEDQDLRVAMMSANSEYYQMYGRPDSMVLNTIRIALSEAARNSAASAGRKDAAPSFEPGQIQEKHGETLRAGAPGPAMESGDPDSRTVERFLRKAP